MEQEGDEALREPLGRWLQSRWPDAERVEVGKFQSPKSGFSARTLVVSVSSERAGRLQDERLVLRLENPEPAIYPQQAPGLDCEVDIQYRAMEAVARLSDIPLAPLVGYESDVSVLGTPFYVMRYVAGEVPVEDPIYTRAGFFFDAAPSDRRRMIQGGLRLLADMHRIDWRPDFEWLVPEGVDPSAERQLDIWEAYARRELRERVHPSLERGFAWLHDNLPETLSPVLSWGDSRPGNIRWLDFEPVCLTDFENVAVAPPEVDLGWWLMFDRWSHESFGGERLEGEPTRDEQRDFYASCLGREVGDTYWFELLGAARYAAIVVRVMNRTVERGLLAPDQMLWLKNPAATCLDQLLDERGI